MSVFSDVYVRKTLNVDDSLTVAGTSNVVDIDSSGTYTTSSVIPASSSTGAEAASIKTDGGILAKKKSIFGAELTVIGDITASSNVTIDGDLSVKGTTTTVDESTLNVTNPYIVLADGNASDDLNIGLLMEHDGPTDPKYSGLYRDKTNKEFHVFNDATGTITNVFATRGIPGPIGNDDGVYANFNASAIESHSTNDSDSSMTGALVVQGGVGIAKKVNIGDGTVADTTGGALRVEGGVSVGKNVWISGTSTDALHVSGGAKIVGALDANSINIASASVADISVTGVTDSTNSTTGALTVAGGVGIAKNLHVGATVNANRVIASELLSDIGVFTSTIDSDSPATGALTVAGGVGIGQNLTAGGNVKCFELKSDSVDTGGITAESLTIQSDGTVTTYELNVTNTAETVYRGTAGIGSYNSPVKLDGGVLVGQNVVIKSLQMANNAANQGEAETGALIVKGGARIEKNLLVTEAVTAGSVVSQDTISAAGQISSSSSVVLDPNGDEVVKLDNTGIKVGDNSVHTYVTRQSVITKTVDAERIRVTDTFDATSIEAPIISAGGILAKGNAIIESTIDSTKPSVGALVVGGGVGIGKNLHVGLGIEVGLGIFANTATIKSSLAVDGPSTLGSGLITSETPVPSTGSPPSKTTDGALIVKGGVSCVKNMVVGYDTSITDPNTAGYHLSVRATGSIEAAEKLKSGTGVLCTKGDSVIESNKVQLFSSNINPVASPSYIPSVTIDGGDGNGGTISSDIVNATNKVEVKTDIGGTLVTTSMTADKTILGGDEVATGTVSTGKGSLKVVGGVNIGKNLIVGTGVSATSASIGTLSVSDTTSSTTSATGAVTVAGGVGVGENLNVGGLLQSTTSTTGAVTVAGGVGVGGNLNVGGNVKITGTLEADSITIPNFSFDKLSTDSVSTDAILQSDCKAVIFVTGDTTITLPSVISSESNGKLIQIANVGTGVVTVEGAAPNDISTFGGAVEISNQWSSLSLVGYSNGSSGKWVIR